MSEEVSYMGGRLPQAPGRHTRDFHGSDYAGPVASTARHGRNIGRKIGRNIARNDGRNDEMDVAVTPTPA